MLSSASFIASSVIPVSLGAELAGFEDAGLPWIEPGEGGAGLGDATGMGQRRDQNGRGIGSALILLANATDETRAGERGVSPFELREMLSGDSTCDLVHIPRVVLWRFGWAASFLLLPGGAFDCSE